MADQNSSTSVTGLGDISMIREIIMGQQITEYNRRLAHIEEWIQRNEEANRQSHEAMQRAFTARMEQLEQLVMQNVESLNQKVQHFSKTDRAQLSDLLLEVSKKLKE
jgi:phage host-nuclease inhibitor protein Gam